MKCNYKWYTYVLSLTIIITAQIITVLPALIIGESNSSPLLLQALNLLPFATGTVALWFAMKYVHRDKFLKLFTANKRINYSKILFGASIWFVLTIIFTIISLWIHPEQQIEWNFSLSNFVFLILMGITLLPIQTTFEELMFRGYIYQGFLRNIDNKWIAMLFSAIIFTSLHLGNPEIITFGFQTMLFQYLTIALIFGVIATLDNGTEVAIGMHYANNFFCMVCVTTEGTVFTTDGTLFRITSPVNDYKDTIALLVVGVIMVGAYYWKYMHKKRIKLN